MNINMILCTTKDYLLGDEAPKGNGLLWHVSDELKYFKELTTNNIVLFGKKTYDVVPVELMKKTRIVEVLRSSTNFDALLKQYENLDKDIFIAGGATIYKHFLRNYPLDNIYLSILKDHVPVDKAHNPIYLDKNLFKDYKKEVVREYPDFIAYRLYK